MRLRCIAPDSFASNCYLLLSEHKGQTLALVIDPGVSVESILQALEQESAVLQGILLTHGHFDHVLSLDALRDVLPHVPTYIHEADAELLTDAKKNAFATLFGLDRTWRSADRQLKDGDTLTLGEDCIHVLHTPGHTRGSVCYQCDGMLLSGDTLFANGYGRYDLYGGDAQALLGSLQSLRALPQQLRIYPGHGESASLSDALAAVLG